MQNAMGTDLMDDQVQQREVTAVKFLTCAGRLPFAPCQTVRQQLSYTAIFSAKQ